jgi:hypothetical protein
LVFFLQLGASGAHLVPQREAEEVAIGQAQHAGSELLDHFFG